MNDSDRDVRSFEDLPWGMRFAACCIWFVLLATCFGDAGMLVMVPAAGGMAFCFKKEIEQGHW